MPRDDVFGIDKVENIWLWYDSTWHWTRVSRAINELSTLTVCKLMSSCMFKSNITVVTKPKGYWMRKNKNGVGNESETVITLTNYNTRQQREEGKLQLVVTT